MTSATESRVRYWLVVAATLAALVWMNYFLRANLESAGAYMYNFYRYFYPAAEKVIFADDYPKWRLLLPFSDMTGSWSPTTLVLAHYVTDWIGPAQSWIVFNAVVIVAAFFLAWFIFRSRVFGFTLSICMGFGTQLYYVYPNSGLIAFPLLFCYYMALMVCAYHVVRAERWRAGWWAAFVFSLIVTALAYEAWLDFLVFAWINYAVVGLLLWQRGQRLAWARLTAVTAVMTIVGMVYVYIKVTYGYGQQRGMESDIVLNYPVLAPAIEDVISNLFLNLYMALTVFLPPMLVSSTAFYQLGGDRLVELQNGYHAPFSYLVPMQAMFMWRYFAGALAVVFGYALFRTARSAWRMPTPYAIALLIFMLMIATGGPTHAMIKARPLNSMAAQTYHVFTAVLGVSLTIAFFAMRAWQRWPSVKGALIVGGVWGVIFYSALARPGMISHQAANSGLGVQVYPNPMAKLKRLLGFDYELPGGLQLYRLERFGAAAASGSNATPGAPAPVTAAPLDSLPLNAPPLPEWTASQGVRVEADGSSWRVDGDDTPIGYQLVSPPIQVPPAHMLLVRPKAVNRTGRACLGVLSADQTAWLRSPDPALAEVAVSSGAHNAVRFVFTNCMPDLAPQRSQFVVREVSYGFVQGAPATR